MAKSPICIITPSGMICSSSPLKRHHPTGSACQDNIAHPQGSKADDVKAKIKETICTPAEKALIGTVAELLLAADPKDNEPFTIVCAKL